jgi:short-subunit dehydrogenase
MSNEGMGPVEAKTCLVTGATSGLGQATAARLAELGATVITVARDRARGEQAAAAIRRRAPRAQVEVLTADLSRLGQVRRWPPRYTTATTASTSWSTTPAWRSSAPS